MTQLNKLRTRKGEKVASAAESARRNVETGTGRESCSSYDRMKAEFEPKAETRDIEREEIQRSFQEKTRKFL